MPEERGNEKEYTKACNEELTLRERKLILKKLRRLKYHLINHHKLQRLLTKRIGFHKYYNNWRWERIMTLNRILANITAINLHSFYL